MVLATEALPGLWWPRGHSRHPRVGVADAGARRVHGVLALLALLAVGTPGPVSAQAHSRPLELEDVLGLLEVADRQRLAVSPDTSAEELRVWCQTTAQTIIPQRKVGRVAPGYEASFLALDSDPLTDFSATQRMVLRVKAGLVMP